MTLPQLYQTITLTSYNGVRYRDNRPEGSGSASPFAMGLNALVTRNTAKLVRSLILQGEWKEYEMVEHARAGRVPDNAMMLNIAVRAAIDRCEGLESFTWGLNTKLLPSAYAGLSNLTGLKNLRIRFPSSRIPRPTCVVPSMPNLQSLILTDIDPLCYADDFSLLLFSAVNLKHLTMHFSPRMRLQNEPSINLETYFKRFLGTKKQLNVESIAQFNVFAKKPEDIDEVCDISKIRHITDIRAVGNEDDESATFLDESWKKPHCQRLHLTSIRTDFLNHHLAQALDQQIHGLQRVYLVNRFPSHLITPPASTSPSDPSPPSNRTSESTPPDRDTTINNRYSTSPTKDRNTILRDAYLNALIDRHGPNLVHLALPTRWPLPLSLLHRLIRAAPNLTQLSIAVESESFQNLRLLLPFLGKLRVMRLLVPTERDIQIYGCAKTGMSLRRIIEEADETHIRVMGREMIYEEGRNEVFPEMKYVILGWKAFELGGMHEIEVPEEEEDPSLAINGHPPDQVLADDMEEANVNGHRSEEQEMSCDKRSDAKPEKMVKVWRRRVKRVPWDAVRDIEILKMDSQEIVPG